MIWITSAFSLFSQKWFQAERDLECLPLHRVIILMHLLNLILLLHWDASAWVSSRTYQLSSSPRHPLMGSCLLILEVCWVCRCEMCLIFLVLPLPIPFPEALWALILLSQNCPLPRGLCWLVGLMDLHHLFLGLLLQVIKIFLKSIPAFQSASALISPLSWQRGWGCSLATQCWKELHRFAPLPGYSYEHWPVLEPDCGAFLWFSANLLLLASPRIWSFNLLWRCRTGIPCGHGSVGLFMKVS